MIKIKINQLKDRQCIYKSNRYICIEPVVSNGLETGYLYYWIDAKYLSKHFS